MKDKREKRASGTQFTVGELFCGCGGFSHGSKRTGRFRFVLGNDIKEFALKTFARNLAEGLFEPIALSADNYVRLFIQASQTAAEPAPKLRPL